MREGGERSRRLGVGLANVQGHTYCIAHGIPWSLEPSGSRFEHIVRWNASGGIFCFVYPLRIDFVCCY